eukprot:5079639-Amphidinium_carterae.1
MQPSRKNTGSQGILRCAVLLIVAGSCARSFAVVEQTSRFKPDFTPSQCGHRGTFPSSRSSRCGPSPSIVVQAAAGSSAIAGASGVWGTFCGSSIGKAILLSWAKLAPVPPFKWFVMFINYILGLPKLWRYYFILSMGQSLTSWLVPGLYAQVVTFTWLSLLKTVSPGLYYKNVAMR